MIRIAANPVVARLLDATEEIKLIVSDLLSYEVAGAQHSAAFQEGTWTGKSTMFNFDIATFPAGLITLVYAHLKSLGHSVQLIRKAAPEPLGKAYPVVNKFGRTEKYDYQYKAVEALLKHRSMIAQIATGGGKSNIANIAFAWIKRPTLFITTRKALMYQMKRSFEESIAWRAANGEPEIANWKVGVMGDSEFNPRRNLNVAMVQTISARLSDPKQRVRMTQILELFEVVILEEAHEASGEGYFQIMKRCRNAAYRLALTATPFMKDDAEANMRLYASAGPIAIKVSEEELINKGILARPYFKYLLTQPSPKVRKLSSWDRAMRDGIVHNDDRNAKIAEYARRFSRAGLSTLILVQRKEHGKILKELIESPTVKVRYIFGESNTEQRDRALSQLAKGEIDVLIGSTILDVGVDVPSIGAVILAGGGKAEVNLRQRIGRGARGKAPGKHNVVYIVDFIDPGNKHLVSHALQRRSIVEGTPGFAENILRYDEEFIFAPPFRSGRVNHDHLSAPISNGHAAVARTSSLNLQA